MLSGRDTDRARDALYSIPPDCDRAAWVKTGMAYHAAGGDFDTFNDWSAPAGNYNAQAARATWRSFKSAPGGVGAGALFGMARDNGWREDGKSTPAPASLRKPAEPPKKPAPGMGAADVWNRCRPATNQHSYIAAKKAAGVPLEALRVVPDGDPVRAVGESMAGALVVPCMAMDGSLCTLQFITTGATAERLKAAGKTTKPNLYAHPVQGWFTVGTIAPGGVVYICEGIGTAWACWQATGAAAVVCFGAGNMGKVAQALRQNDDTARLVLVPDVGKESDAAKIAAAVSGMVAAMPDGWEKNSDVNDLMQRDGLDVLQLLLETASEPPAPEVEPEKVHPLARFVDIGGTPKPPRWVIPGFIGHGVVVIAGAHGVGKTTALLPLAMRAAGLLSPDLPPDSLVDLDLLRPRQWRHVIYITEDVEQAQRILTGIVGHLGIGLDMVRERVHIVEAVRLDPVFVATVGATYRGQFTRTVEGVEVLPLVVLDTKSAVLALENENDNAEASSMMAALKQGFDGLPVWLIGHVAKANLTRSDVSGLTSRGASAIEGDANQTMFLIREGESRFLVQGKVRFESRWPELEIVSHTSQTTALDEFGNLETVVLRWGIAAPAQQSRKEAAEQAAEQQRLDDEASLRQDIRDAVETAWVTGNPLNRAGVKAKVRRKASDVVAMLENLLNERWLYEVAVPAKIRIVNSKSAFLVNLATEEHESVFAGAGLPAHKLVIPASWQKPAVHDVPEGADSEIPPVPAPEGESLEADHVEA